MPDCSCPGWKESWGLWLAEGRGGQAVQSPWRTRPRTLCAWQCCAGSVLPPGPPVALSHLCSSCPSLLSVCPCPAPQCGPDYDLLCWPRTPLFSKGESLGTQNWHPSRQHFGLFKAHSGRWAEVYIFLIYFLIKKKRSTRCCCGDSVGCSGAGSFQEPDGWDVQRSWQTPLYPEPSEAQPRNTGQCAGPAGCWAVERNLAPAISV